MRVTVQEPAAERPEPAAPPTSLQAEVSADPASNSVLVLARAPTWELVRDALEQLDTPIPHVQVEASLVEVTLTSNTRYGVQTIIDTGSGDAALTDGGVSASGAPQLVRAFPGFSAVYQGRDIASVLNALESRARVRVLSSPRVTVLNGQLAAVQAGAQVPIASATTSGGVATPGGNTTQIDYRDTGVILRVVPRAGARGLVRLDIEQDATEVAQSAGVTSADRISPSFSSRRIVTSVAVQNGDTLVIGGLFSESRTRGRSSIPFLSRLPLLGGTVFGRTNDQTARTELLLLIRPRIIRPLQ